MAVVAVGFAEALAAGEAVWSLQRAGFEVVAFHRRGSRPPLRLLRDVRMAPITAPEADAEAAVAELAALVRDSGAVTALPLDDPSLWLLAAAAEALPVPVAGPTGERARFALDKRRQLQAAREAGFRVPITIELDSPADPPGELPYPCVVKPALAAQVQNGSLTRGAARVCADRGELEAAASGSAGSAPLLVQPLITGRGEGMFGLVQGGGVSAWSAHRRLRMMNPAGSGSSACVSAPVADDVRGPAERLLSAAGWHGMFMIELLREAGGPPWFVELNGRVWGSIALSRRLGLEYPAWAVRQALGEELQITETANGSPVVCRHLGRELVHLLHVLRGPATAAFNGSWPGRAQTLREVARVKRTERWYNLRRDHLAFFAADTVRTVTGALGGRR